MVSAAPLSYGFSDDFNDNALAPLQWSSGSLTADEASVDASISVTAQNKRLEITPRSNSTSRHFNGCVTAAYWDLTAAMATIEVVQVASGKADTVFAVGVDSDNWCGFVVENGELYFQSKTRGRKYPMRIAYNHAEHRFWRMRHDAKTDTLFWETSADEVTWKVQHAETPRLGLTSVRISLSAGTSQAVSAPGKAIFDNFRLSR